MVILNRKDYFNRMDKLIRDSAYVHVTKDPLRGMVAEANKAITKHGPIIEIPRWKMSVPNPKVARLYGLPKTHKPGEKMRPISDNVNTPTYKIAKTIVNEFNKLQQPEGLYVKNTIEFVNKIRNVTLEEDEIMISFDVEALYPSVPINTAITMVRKWLETTNITDDKVNSLTELTEICMKQSQFIFNGKIYKQTEGTTMGNPLSCFVSNVFMSNFEMDLQKRGLLPKIWWRYVDDVFSVVKKQKIDDIIQLLNSQYQSINFTYEIENNNKLNFLDISLIRKDRVVHFDIYRKPSNTSRYITSDSFCPTSHKMAAFHSMIHRMVNIPLPIEHYMKEVETIKEFARMNGYRENIVDKLIRKHQKQKRYKDLTTLKKEKEENGRRVCFNFAPPITNKIADTLHTHNYKVVYNSNNSLGRLLGTTKDKQCEKDKEGIYEITCKKCKMKYIGQTKRNIGIRFKEHISHIKNKHPEKSAVALHAFNANHKNIDDYEVKLVKHVSKHNHLDCWESLYMARNVNSMNIDVAPIESTLFKLT